jgi:hypothetical protein
MREVLDRHLGHDPRLVGGRPGNVSEGEYIATLARNNAQELLGAMDHQQQKDRLRNVGRLMGELVRAQKALHDDVDWQIVYALGEGMKADDDDDREETEDEANALLRLKAWDALAAMSQIIDRATPAICRHIDAAPAAGRRNLRNMMIVRALRRSWERRKKTPAPMSIKDAGPFTDFIVDAFKALGLKGNPRSAMDSWRGYRAKYPKDCWDPPVQS